MVPYGFILFRVTQGFSEILKKEQVGKRTKGFLQLRSSLLKNWWSCRRKRCDYYQLYQAYGSAELTHTGYHSAEKLALEHRANCDMRNERECEICLEWAKRLRGELWEVLMASQGQTEKKQYGFVQ